MLLGILDAVTFQISKVLESLFDAIEYRLAKRAIVAATKRRSRAPQANSPLSILSPHDFRNVRRIPNDFQNRPPQR
jgi:hypothetical protein